ncbi:MAG: hypothetical protein DRQ55_06130 [Planctomycetota bacterium]|nr:MAG: hypothetical protein DRQ55_06130 [Planctomycetota bacterium]
MSTPLRAVLGVLLADARAHRGQSATTLAGVAVGIAVIVAIRLASQAALHSFAGTYQALTGVATHQLTGVEPLDPARLIDLRSHPSVRAVQPVIESTLVVPPAHERAPSRHNPRPLVQVEGGPSAPRSLRLLGIDPFQAAPFLDLSDAAVADAGASRLFQRLLLEPGLVAMGPGTARVLGVSDGDQLSVQVPGGRKTLRVALLNEPRLDAANPPFVLTDLASAQELLGLGASVLRYDLVLEGDGAELPVLPGERLERASRRGERASSLTEAFATNLMCLGFLAVLVGAFVVFSMAQFAVSRRRGLLGRLRCLGCTARGLLLALLSEAALLGLLGGALGLGAGALLARVLVSDVARSVGTLYGPVGGAPVPELDGLSAALGLAVAVISSVGATWAPARSAARTAPVAVAGITSEDPPPPRWLPWVLLFVAALLLVPQASAVMLPAVSVLAVLLASATAIPRLLGLAVSRVRRPALLSLACGQIMRTLGRAGAAAGALTMPLAMTVAVVTMVGSFRQEVMGWSQAVLAADVYIKPLWFELAPERARLPDGLLAALEARDDVASVDRLRSVEEPSPEGSFMVAGARLDTLRARDSLRVLQGGELPAIVAALEAGEVLVSEPLARRRELSPGHTLELAGRQGARTLTVAGVFQDFSLDRGYALLAEATFIELYGAVPVRNAAVLMRPGGDPAALVDQLASRFPDAVFRTVERLREDVGHAFDDTFAITFVLQAISTALALVGVITALLCLHIERRQELGVLRALGARLRTVGALLVLEALLITGVAALAALPVGLALSWILVDIINERSFGWTFPMRVDGLALAAILGSALVAGVLAALVPWLLVARSRVASLVETRR